MTVPLEATDSHISTSEEPWSLLNWFLAPPQSSQPNAKGISTLTDRTQANVTGTLQDNLQNSPAWNNSSLALCGLLDMFPIVSELMGMGTGKSKPEQLLSGGQNLADQFFGMLGTGLEALLVTPLMLLDALVNFATGMLGFGNVHSSIPIIGSGQVSTKPQNLLADGLFGSSTSFNPLFGWKQDSTKSPPSTSFGVAGSAPAGSAHVQATGGTQPLLSNAIHVDPGDTLNASTKVAWEGLGGPGTTTGTVTTPAVLGVNLYNANDQLLSSTPLAALGGAGGVALTPNPGLAELGSDGAVGEFGDWTELANSFKVPAMVAHPVTGELQQPVTAAVVFTVTDAANAGDLWWSDASATKTNLITQDTVHELPTDLRGIRDTVGGVDDSTLGDMNARLAAISPTTGVVDGRYVPEVTATIDNITNRLQGTSGTDWSTEDSASALTGTRSAGIAAAASIANISAAITTMAAQIADLGGSTTKRSFVDTFERVNGTDLDWGWAQSDSGTGYGTLATPDGHNADIVNSYGSRYCTAVYDAAISDTETDYQILELVLGRLPTGRAGAAGYNDLLARVNADHTAYVRFRIDGDRNWWLHTIIASSPMRIASGTLSWLPTTITLICGELATLTPRSFLGKADQAILFNETDSVSYYGSDQRKVGFAAGFVDPGNPAGSVNFFSGGDQ